MAKIPDNVEQSVKRFLAAIKRLKQVDRAYLYGSQINGTATEWSDIDLAVISADFSSDMFEERLALMRLAAEIDDRIEPWPFTPDSFESSDPLASEILRTGQEV
jgi:predicted nucleotidyltransferase